MEREPFYSRFEIKSPPLSLSIDVSYNGVNGLPKFLGVMVNQSKSFVNESAEALIDKILASKNIISDSHKKIIASSIEIINSDKIYVECRKITPSNKTLVVSVRYFDLFHTKNNI